MDFSTGFTTALYQVGQFLAVPTMACLILLILVVVFCLGALLVELFTERRYFKVNHRAVMVRMHDADYGKIDEAILDAGLLKSQQAALLRVSQNMGLPDEELCALSQVELEALERANHRRVNLTDIIAKIAPMLGLMGTLIPLGPGIVAMGQGDLEVLSASMNMAFSTTIAGLVVAIVAVIISRIRTTWYSQYSTLMDALMNCVLEEAAQAREEGVALPYGDWRQLLNEAASPVKAAKGAGGNA